MIAIPTRTAFFSLVSLGLTIALVGAIMALLDHSFSKDVFFAGVSIIFIAFFLDVVRVFVENKKVNHAFVQEEHECKYPEEASLVEHAPKTEGGCISYCVSICLECRSAKVFPKENYLSTTLEHRKELKEELAKSGVRIIEPE